MTPTVRVPFLRRLVSTDPADVAHVYLTATVVAGIVALLAIFAVLAERLIAGPGLLGPEGAARVSAAHGLIAVHLVLVPALPAILGNLRLPGELGLENVAFPRLSRAAAWLHLLGFGVVMAGVLSGGVHPWAFDAGLGVAMPAAALVSMLGVLLVWSAATLNGLTLMVTLRLARAERPRSLFAFGVGLMASVLLVATPVLGLTALVVAIERTVGLGLFDPSLGGDPGLYRQFAWFAVNATLTAAVLPAVGLALDLLADAAGQAAHGRGFARGAMLTLAVFGVLAWGRHLLFRGQSPMADMVGSFFGLLSAVPATLLVMVGLSRLARTRGRLDGPTLWAGAFVLLFAGGVVAGVLTSALGTATALVGTSFTTGHLHTFVAGGVLFAWLGGMAAWRRTGDPADEAAPGASLGRWAPALTFVGASLVFPAMFVAGLSGVAPRDGEPPTAHLGLPAVALLGGLLIASGLALAAFDLWRRGHALSPAPAR